MPKINFLALGEVTSPTARLWTLGESLSDPFVGEYFVINKLTFLERDMTSLTTLSFFYFFQWSWLSRMGKYPVVSSRFIVIFKTFQCVGHLKIQWDT